MSVLVAAGPGSSNWARQLRAALTARGDGLDIEVGTVDDVEAAEVEFVVMWNLPPEQLATYPALRAILMIGAGYDHLDAAALPDVPVVRLVDPGMAHDIALYVLSWVVHFQRDFDVFAAAQQEHAWRQEVPPRFSRDVTVGVLGAGAIGTVVLDLCASQGFETIGWSRSNHDRSLTEFFESCDIVVNLVPSSDATRHLIGSDELAALGDGVLVNVGRGTTVDDDALLHALDGELRAAVLDVFVTEPLPTDSPIWDHPKVVVTPHIAGRSDPVTATPIIARSIEQIIRGERPETQITWDSIPFQLGSDPN